MAKQFFLVIGSILAVIGLYSLLAPSSPQIKPVSSQEDSDFYEKLHKPKELTQNDYDLRADLEGLEASRKHDGCGFSAVIHSQRSIDYPIIDRCEDQLVVIVVQEQKQILKVDWLSANDLHLLPGTPQLKAGKGGSVQYLGDNKWEVNWTASYMHHAQRAFFDDNTLRNLVKGIRFEKSSMQFFGAIAKLILNLNKIINFK